MTTSSERVHGDVHVRSVRSLNCGNVNDDCYLDVYMNVYTHRTRARQTSRWGRGLKPIRPRRGVGSTNEPNVYIPVGRSCTCTRSFCPSCDEYWYSGRTTDTGGGGPNGSHEEALEASQIVQIHQLMYLSSKPKLVGNWTLPSGNNCHVYLSADLKTGQVGVVAGLHCQWDEPPSPDWPAEDVAHWETVTFPAIMRAVADLTGHRRALGVRL
jgi:hypothetical protein